VLAGEPARAHQAQHSAVLPGQGAGRDRAGRGGAHPGGHSPRSRATGAPFSRSSTTIIERWVGRPRLALSGTSASSLTAAVPLVSDSAAISMYRPVPALVPIEVGRGWSATPRVMSAKICATACSVAGGPKRFSRYDAVSTIMQDDPAPLG